MAELSRQSSQPDHSGNHKKSFQGIITLETTEKKVYSVSDINRNIKAILANSPGLHHIWLQGEISNFSASASGHIYFSLKDSASTIRCTFFSYSNKNYRGQPLHDGMKIQAFGSINVYEPNGSYSLNINRIEEFGKGDILYQIEKLKQELFQKGIFAKETKKPLPRFPKTIGVATSQHGAALRDIIRMIKDRNPGVNILLAPCIVQGEQATRSIVNAIRELNRPEWQVDVIIAGRGGGSFEDLMAFNEEDVVMAFYHSTVPIISAVGHQIDSPLSDLAADEFCSTPTAAAERAVPELLEIEEYLQSIGNELKNALRNQHKSAHEQLQWLSSKRIFTEPQLLLIDRQQKLDTVINTLQLVQKNNLSQHKNRLQKYDSLKYSIGNLLSTKKNRFAVLASRIDNFSPLSTLHRGYAVVRNQQKQVIYSQKQTKIGETLEIILAEGKLAIEVKKIKP